MAAPGPPLRFTAPSAAWAVEAGFATAVIAAQLAERVTATRSDGVAAELSSAMSVGNSSPLLNTASSFRPNSRERVTDVAAVTSQAGDTADRAIPEALAPVIP